jgi:hypothetical protein
MGSRGSRLASLVWFAGILPIASQAQIIPFESGGLNYKALTHGGVTVMFAPLPLRVQGYAVLQVSISNGSPIAWSVKPEDFRFDFESGGTVQALPAAMVVGNLLHKASRSDVTRMVTAYESVLYGNTEIHSTNGYESRREDAMAVSGPGRLKAAAAASAIVLIPATLAPGQSTDGAVFYPNGGRPLGSGRLFVHVGGEDFVFPTEAEAAPHGR